MDFITLKAVIQRDAPHINFETREDWQGLPELVHENNRGIVRISLVTQARKNIWNNGWFISFQYQSKQSSYGFSRPTDQVSDLLEYLLKKHKDLFDFQNEKQLTLF